MVGAGESDQRVKKTLTILGSTGSIGESTLDVVARHAERFEVFALAAHRNVERLAQQCRRFKPRYAAVADESKYAELKSALRETDTEPMAGMSALLELAEHEKGDTLISGIAGGVGLQPLMGAARAGKRILFANKEAVVMAGALLKRACAESGASLLPLDSEHNAVLQCLAGEQTPTHVVLTASGGPFLNTPLKDFAKVTPKMARAHPNWNMGGKISVDSATLMNKGLEVIEAVELFDLSAAQVRAVIHPQSIVHALVAYADRGYIAQLATPDMRIPIAASLVWPERVDSGAEPLDLAAVGELTFSEIDTRRFPCFALAMRVLEMGHSARVVMNAANEEAVDAFLRGELRFDYIVRAVEETLAHIDRRAEDSLNAILELDADARRAARRIAADLGDR